MLKLLSVYETEAYFYYKNYIYIYSIYKSLFFFIQESYFYAEDKNFNLKLSKMLYYHIRCLFADVLMFKHKLPLNKKIPYLGYAD